MSNKNFSVNISSAELKNIIELLGKNKNISISSIDIKNSIIIKGTIPLKITNYNFLCELIVFPMVTNNIPIKIISFSPLNLSIPKKIQDFALKSLIKIVSSRNYENNGDIITINVKEKLIKYGLNPIDISNITTEVNSLKIDFINNQPDNFIDPIRVLLEKVS